MNDEQDDLLERNLAFMARNIPPDDIYAFAEANLAMASFYLRKWAGCVDIDEECKKDEVAKVYVTRLLSYLHMRENNVDMNDKVGLEKIGIKLVDSDDDDLLECAPCKKCGAEHSTYIENLETFDIVPFHLCHKCYLDHFKENCA